ncbi:MAG: nuclear transport factor 2 family protein [Gemmatimonadales bacterium]
MSRVRLVLTMVMGLLPLAPWPAAGQSRAAADEIAGLVARYDSSWTRRDTTAIARFLAPEYQYFTSRGGVWRREAVLRLVSNPSYLLEYARRSEVTVTRRASTAVVSSRWEGGGSYEGERFTDDQRCGLVWIETPGGWRLLSEHCTQIVPRETDE